MSCSTYAIGEKKVFDFKYSNFLNKMGDPSRPLGPMDRPVQKRKGLGQLSFFLWDRRGQFFGYLRWALDGGQKSDRRRCPGKSGARSQDTEEKIANSSEKLNVIFIATIA